MRFLARVFLGFGVCAAIVALFLGLAWSLGTAASVLLDIVIDVRKPIEDVISTGTMTLLCILLVIAFGGLFWSLGDGLLAKDPLAKRVAARRGRELGRMLEKGDA